MIKEEDLKISAESNSCPGKDDSGDVFVNLVNPGLDNEHNKNKTNHVHDAVGHDEDYENFFRWLHCQAAKDTGGANSQRLVERLNELLCEATALDEGFNDWMCEHGMDLIMDIEKQVEP